MSISVQQINESLRIMKELGLIASNFSAEDLWSDCNDNNSANKIISFIE